MPSSDNDRLKLIIESILFVADEPVEIAAFARISGHNEGAVLDAVDAIAADFQGRGLRIQRAAGALETLAIIAYKQPVGRTTIEAIRGVNCDRALATLRARGLVTEVGRASAAG